jgi:hypothetical protein
MVPGHSLNLYLTAEDLPPPENRSASMATKL